MREITATPQTDPAHQEWTDWIGAIRRNDPNAHWFWITINPRTAVFRDVLNRSEAERLDAQGLVDKTSPITALLIKKSLHAAMVATDSTYSRNQPSRQGTRASIAAFLVPAVTVSGRRIHYHGWVRCVLPPRVEIEEVVLREDAQPVRALCPRPLAVFVRHLAEVIGDNIHLPTEQPSGQARTVAAETHDMLGKHAAYLRPAPHIEERFHGQPIAQPGWYWTPVLTAVA